MCCVCCSVGTAREIDSRIKGKVGFARAREGTKEKVETYAPASNGADTIRPPSAIIMQSVVILHIGIGALAIAVSKNSEQN